MSARDNRVVRVMSCESNESHISTFVSSLQLPERIGLVNKPW